MMLETADAGIALGITETMTAVASRFHVDGERVHAPDADDLTMIIDALEAWRRQGHDAPVEATLSDEEQHLVSASLPWLSLREGAPYTLHRFACGAAVVKQGASVDVDSVSVAPDLRIPVDADAHAAMTAAWEVEMSEHNVSQGAYVSSQVYALGMEARLGMKAQAGPIWPPRGAVADGSRPEDGGCLPMTAQVVSWTRLIAAGCPSEFAVRAPVLGGLTSMILAFDEGPSGVFLYADGHPAEVDIGDEVQLVVRRVYAQDGMLRYGRKAVRASA